MEGRKHLTGSSCRAVFSTSFIPLCLYKREKLKISQECNTSDCLPRKHGRVHNNPFNHSTSPSSSSTQGVKTPSQRCCWAVPAAGLSLLPPHRRTASEIFISPGHSCCLWGRFSLNFPRSHSSSSFGWRPLVWTCLEAPGLRGLLTPEPPASVGSSKPHPQLASPSPQMPFISSQHQFQAEVWPLPARGIPEEVRKSLRTFLCPSLCLPCSWAPASPALCMPGPQGLPLCPARLPGSIRTRTHLWLQEAHQDSAAVTGDLKHPSLACPQCSNELLPSWTHRNKPRGAGESEAGFTASSWSGACWDHKHC